MTGADVAEAEYSEPSSGVDDDSLSEGGIAGLAIMSIVLFVAVVAVWYFYFPQHQSQSVLSPPPSPAVPVNVSQSQQDQADKHAAVSGVEDLEAGHVAGDNKQTEVSEAQLVVVQDKSGDYYTLFSVVYVELTCCFSLFRYVHLSVN